MIHTVPLDQFPDGLLVPDTLQERFWYDSDRKRLCFDGFMSKADYDRLRNLKHEWSYQHAVDELFRVSVPDAKPGGSLRAKSVALAFLTLGILSLSGITLWWLVS